MNNTELEGLFDQIRRLFAAEYARGDRDAITKIMQAAKGGAGGDNSGKDLSRRVRATIAHRRAPAGAADELIRRILTERHHRGASALEIHAAAAGMETLVSSRASDSRSIEAVMAEFIEIRTESGF